MLPPLRGEHTISLCFLFIQFSGIPSYLARKNPSFCLPVCGRFTMKLTSYFPPRSEWL